MIQKDNLDIILKLPEKSIRFFSPSKQGIYSQLIGQADSTKIFEDSILEYDLDTDPYGNINLVILDQKGNLYLYRYDGKKWSNYKIYQFNLLTDEVRQLQIKCTSDHTFITLCERTQITSNQWTIVSLSSHAQGWKKSTLSSLFLNYPVMAYRLAKDTKNNLYVIYLNNNNIVYNLNLIVFNHKTLNWSDPIFISNCIYIKTFHLDALVDNNDGIHLAWTDKYKKQFCVKYVYIPLSKAENLKPTTTMLLDEPIFLNQLALLKHSIHCYGITLNNIYHSNKPLHDFHLSQGWKSYDEPAYELDNLFIYKTAGSVGHSLANYYLSDNRSNYHPIQIEEFDNLTNVAYSRHNTSITSSESIHKPANIIRDSDPIDIPHDQQILKLQADLFKKNQQIDATQKLINSLQSEIIYIKQELKNLNDQNTRYVQIINESKNKYKEIYDYTIKFGQLFEDTVSKTQLSELSKNIEILSHHFVKMKEEVTLCKTQNEELRQYTESIRNEGFLKKFFG